MEKYYLFLEKHYDPYMSMRRAPSSNGRHLPQAL